MSGPKKFGKEGKIIELIRNGVLSAPTFNPSFLNEMVDTSKPQKFGTDGERLDVDNCGECPCVSHELRAPPADRLHCGLMEQLEEQHAKRFGAPPQRLTLTRAQVEGKHPPPRECPLLRPEPVLLHSPRAQGRKLPDFVKAPPNVKPLTADDVFADRMRRRRNR